MNMNLFALICDRIFYGMLFREGLVCQKWSSEGTIKINQRF